MDQPGKVANPARGQLDRVNEYISASAPENLVSRDGFGSPVPRQPAHLLNTQAESGACSRDSSRVPRRRPFIYFKPPYAIVGSVPNLSSHHAIIACRWRSLSIILFVHPGHRQVQETLGRITKKVSLIYRGVKERHKGLDARGRWLSSKMKAIFRRLKLVRSMCP